jgi:nitrate reductase NapE component
MITVKRGVASKIIIYQQRIVTTSSSPTSNQISSPIPTTQKNESLQLKPQENKTTPSSEEITIVENRTEEKIKEKSTITGMFVKFVTSPLFIAIAICGAIGFVVYKYRYLLPFFAILFLIPIIYAQETEINVSVNVTAPPPPKPITAQAILLGATTPTILTLTLILYVFKEALGTDIKKIIKIIIVAAVGILAISIYLSVAGLVI